MLARDSRAPSIMLAWFSSSERMKSSLPRIALTVPALAAKPLWKTTQASTFLKRAIFSSSSMWMRMVPAMVRTAPEPTPKVRVASMRGLNQPGMVGQAQVVVAGQVDDLAAVVVAHRGLLVVEDAELEVGALGAQFVEHGGQMGKLGARSGLCHGDSPQTESIARQEERKHVLEQAKTPA